MKIKGKKLLLSSLVISLISLPTIFSTVSTNIKKQNQEIMSTRNGISPLIDVPSIDAKRKISDAFVGNNPVEIAYVLNNISPTSQAEMIKYLSYLFDGIDSIDNRVYEIRDIKALANGEEGTLFVNFSLYKKSSNGNSILANIYEGDFNESSGLSKGITKLLTYNYVDSQNSYDDIVNQLRTDPSNYLVTNNILINLANGINKSKITLGNVHYDNINKEITIDSINVKNAIGPLALISSLDFPGKITIHASNAPIVLGETEIYYNNAYLFDDSFMQYNTAEKFKQYIVVNKTDDAVINLIMSKVNPPNGATITVGNITLNGSESVDVEFNIDKYYNDNNELVNSSKTFTINYFAFPVATKVTHVKTENLLTGHDYAYEYTKDELLVFINEPSNNVIVNPVPNTVVSFVDEPFYDNRTGMITANIKLDKHYNEFGQEAGNKTFANIKFKAPKVVVGPTFIQRNINPVNETINEIDAMSDAQKQEWAKKYIEKINPSASTDYNSLRVEKVSSYPTRSSANESADALYKVSTKLTNYFVNDKYYTMNKEPSANEFVVYINAKINLVTKVKDNVVNSGIDTSNPINLLTVKEVIQNLNDVQNKVKQWIIDNFTNIFENYSKVATLDDILDINFQNEGQENIRVTLILKDASTLTGKGDIQFSFVINHFLDPATPIVGKTLDLNQAVAAGFVGLDNTVYTIDFESKYKNSIKQILFDNMNSWFDNTVSSGVNLKDRVQTADNFIQGDLHYSYNTNSVTVSGNFMSWNNASLNPYDNLNPILCSITIKGEWGNDTNSFNQIETSAKGIQIENAIDINNVPELRVLQVDDPTLPQKLSEYISNNKNLFLNNYPNALKISGLNILLKDKSEGIIQISLLVRNAKVIATNEMDLGYANKTFNIYVKGFFAPTKPTSGRVIDLKITSKPGGIQSLVSSAFVFEFVSNNAFVQEFIRSFKDNPNVWLKNYPTEQKIAEHVAGGGQIIDESTIQISKGLRYGTPALIINADFVSWNQSGNKNDPLEMINQTIIIYNFNNKNTTTSSLQLSDFGGLELNNQTLSAQDAVDLLNSKKSVAKDYFLNRIRDLMVVISNAPSTLEQTLRDAINNENFEFVLVGKDEIKVVFKNIDQSSNDGLDKITANLEIKISNRFNSTDLNTVFIKKVINWNDNNFDLLFGGNVSKFAFDWKVTNGPNQASLTRFENNVKNNMNEYFVIENGPAPANQKTTELKNITFDTTENNNFISDINNLTAKLTVTYKGYVNGTWNENATAIVDVNLKPIPSQQQIIDQINTIVKEKLDGKYLINDKTYDKVIAENGQEILDTIVEALKGFLPENVVVGNDKPSIEDMFELNINPDTNEVTIAIKQESIAIKPNTGVPSNLANQFGKILVPVAQNQILIHSLEPSAHWLDWVIYVIIAGTFIALIIIITAYELYAKNKRIQSSKTFGYSA